MRKDPLPSFRFVVSLLDVGGNGLEAGSFAECFGLGANLETIDYLEGGVNDRVHRFPSRAGYSNITLRRGVSSSDELWRWYQAFVEGRGKRRDGLITLQNELGEPIKTWAFSRGLPVKWSGPGLNALSSEVAIEDLEIAHEKLELRL